MAKLKAGDRVVSKTPAGLWLSKVPTKTPGQIVGPCGVFRGVGEVVTSVAYRMKWEDYDPYSGQLVWSHTGWYTNVLVRCGKLEGWAGEGALIKVDPEKHEISKNRPLQINEL